MWREIEGRLSNVTSGLLPCEGAGAQPSGKSGPASSMFVWSSEGVIPGPRCRRGQLSHGRRYSPVLFLQDLLLFLLTNAPSMKASKLQSRGRRTEKQQRKPPFTSRLPTCHVHPETVLLVLLCFEGLQWSSSSHLPIKCSFSLNQLQIKSMETDPRGRSGENTPGLRITATSHPRHHLIVDLVFHNSLPPRMSYFLGGSFIPTSELKEAQKVTPGSLDLLRLAYVSEGKWHRISNWETLLHRSLCCS